MQTPEKVFIGLSGGVDSSVAALLLKQAGCDVTGIHLRLWEPDDLAGPSDTAARALAVGRVLGIPVEVIDFRQVFRSEVVQHYFAALRSGATPNPCVLCNQSIKWGALLEVALARGAQALASGHYGRLARDEHGIVSLYRALDHSKDQSYFLSALPQHVFQHMRLPLGEMFKRDVRQIAQQAGLPTSQTAESEDLCFLQHTGQEAFIRQYAPELLVPGPICDLDGNQIGSHQGLPLYTIGQRKGIRLSAPEPYYVVAKDTENNRLIVGKADTLRQDVIIARDVNWVSGSVPDPSKTYQIKVRSTATLLPGIFSVSKNRDIIVTLRTKLRDITAGQRLVIYDGELCLGSAEIVLAQAGIDKDSE